MRFTGKIRKWNTNVFMPEYKYVFVESDQVGCALVTVPAVYLAQNVLPEGMDAFSLHGLPLVEWEKKLDLKELTFME